MSKLRLAVVGLGAHETSRARSYVSTIVKLTDHYTLCAICDASEESLKIIGDRFNIQSRYTDYRQMLKQGQPDVVFVLVPTDGQTPCALTAVEHGCHIITEIPYAITMPIGDAMAKVCAEKGVKWEIAENVWRWPHQQLKQQIVREGLLGTITHARMSYTHGSYHGFNGMRMALGKKAIRAMGYAQEIEVLPYESYGGQSETTRWWESGTIEFEEGITCLYEMPPTPSPQGICWDVEGTQGYLSGNALTLFPDGQKVSYPFEEIYEQIDGEQILSAVQVNTDPPIVWENPYKQYKVSADDDVAKAAILTSLHRAVTEDTDPIYGSANARQDLELWVAIRQSAEQNNTWIDLPITEETDLEHRILTEYIRRYGGDPIADKDALLNTQFDRLSALWTVAGWL